MHKLILLEMKKSGKGSVVKAVSKVWIPLVIAISFLLLFLVLENIPFSAYLPAGEYQDLVNDLTEMPPTHVSFFQITSLIGLIFSATMYATYVVREVKTKKIQQLYLYPISKTNILFAKISAAFLMSILAMAVCSISGIFLMLLVKNEPISLGIYLRQLLDIFLVPLVGLIPMTIGMKRKSVISTVVYGILFATILGGNLGPFTLWSYFGINIVLAALGVWLSFLTLKNPKTTECFG